MENKKEIFKLLIKEFHELKPPQIIKRDYQLPDCYTAVTSGSPAIPLSVSSRPSSIIAITGPRRCGKTYFIHQLIDHFSSNATSPVPRSRLIYINFEDDRLLPLSLSDLGALPDAYFELHPDNKDKEVLVFLDEIHHVEGWEFFLRRLLDQENIRLFITSSSSKFCTPSLSSALSCRTLEFAISPLSFKEFLVFKGLDITPDFAYSNVRFKVINLLEEYITYGGYPEVVLTDPSLKFRILKNYYDIFIYKDLVQQFAIRNIDLLKGLLKYLITHIGSGFSINSYFLAVRRNLHISRETVLDYVSFLEQKGLISLVPIFSEYPKVQQVNPKKVYSLDNGIRNAVSFPLPHQEEKLAKNLVFQKLVRSGNEVFYWKRRREVDFVAWQNGKLRGINVSYGRELGDAETGSLLEFQDSVGKSNADMTIITKDTEKIDRDISFCPLWKWLLTSP
jgi:predicted AAA+ superfamily ATPase